METYKRQLFFSYEEAIAGYEEANEAFTEAVGDPATSDGTRNLLARERDFYGSLVNFRRAVKAEDETAQTYYWQLADYRRLLCLKARADRFGLGAAGVDAQLEAQKKVLARAEEDYFGKHPAKSATKLRAANPPGGPQFA